MPRDVAHNHRSELQQLGEKIRQLRRARRMTQSQLGAWMVPRMSHAAVSDVERGLTNSGLLRARQFAAVLGVTPGELLLESQQAASETQSAGPPVVDLTPEELESIIRQEVVGQVDRETFRAITVARRTVWLDVREALPASGDAIVGEGCYE